MVEILPPLLSENYRPAELTRRKIRRAPIDPGVKACQRCSRRKIKCSNQVPCGGCTKAGVECISRSVKRTYDGEEVEQSTVKTTKHDNSYILSRSCIGQGHEPIGIFTTRYVIPDEDTVPNLEFDLENGSWALKAPKAKCSELPPPPQTRNPACTQPSWYSNISVCSLWSCNCNAPHKRARTSVIKLTEMRQKHDSKPAPKLTSPPSITSSSSDCSSLQSPPTPPSHESQMEAEDDQDLPIFDPFSFLNYEQHHQNGDTNVTHFEDALMIGRDSSDDDDDARDGDEDDETVEIRNMNIVQDDWLF